MGDMIKAIVNLAILFVGLWLLYIIFKIALKIIFTIGIIAIIGYVLYRIFNGGRYC